MFSMHWSSQWLGIALDATLKGTLFLLLCGGIALGVRRHAALRHFMTLVAFAGLLLLPLLCATVPQWQLSRPKPASNPIGVQPVSASHADSAPQAAVPQALPVGIAQPVVATVNWAQDRAAVLFVCWLLGAFVVSTRALLGRREVRRLEKASDVLPASNPLATLTTELARQLKIRRPVVLRLASSDSASMPMTWGLWRPVVLLPAAAESWPIEKLRSVLLHELGHVRRSDWASQHLAALACALYWFNPLVWFAAATLRAQGERATDDCVLTAGVKASEYCAHLLELAQNASGLAVLGNATSYAVPMARGASISTRLRALLDERQRRRGVTRPTAVSIITLFCFALVGLAALNTRAKSQPLTPTEDEAMVETKPADLTAPDPVKAKAAQDVLAKSRAAYAALKSYHGTTNARMVTFNNGNPTAPYAGTADITWDKPNLLFISGQDAGNRPYSIVSNTEGSWYKVEYMNKGQWSKTPSASLAIASMTGVAAQAPTTIPTILMNLELRLPLSAKETENGFLEKAEEVEGHPCFKITSKTVERTMSWWIDKESFLLRRIVSTYTQEQVKKMNENVDKAMKQYAAQTNKPYVAVPHGEPHGFITTQTFEIIAINEPIDAKIFASPANN